MRVLKGSSSEVVVYEEENRSVVRVWIPGWHSRILPQGHRFLGWQVIRRRSDVHGQAESLIEWEGGIRLRPPACALISPDGESG